MAACIVGFLLLYALQTHQNVPCLCLIAQKMPCRSALCRMPGGVGGAVQAARFAGGLGVAAARAGWCPPGAFLSQGRVQRIPVWLCAIGYGYHCEATMIG